MDTKNISLIEKLQQLLQAEYQRLGLTTAGKKTAGLGATVGTFFHSGNRQLEIDRCQRIAMLLNNANRSTDAQFNEQLFTYLQWNCTASKLATSLSRHADPFISSMWGGKPALDIPDLGQFHATIINHEPTLGVKLIASYNKPEAIAVITKDLDAATQNSINAALGTVTATQPRPSA